MRRNQVVQPEAESLDDQPLARVPAPPAPPAPLVQASSDEQLVRLWLHGRPASTTAAYAADVASFLAHAARPLREVTLGDLQSWGETMAELAPATRSRRLGTMRSLFRFAHELGYLALDVSRPLRRPQLRDRLSERILSEDQVRRLIAAAPDEPTHALLRLLYLCGLRISEACALTWRDMTRRQSGGIASVFGKGGKTRQVLVPQGLWKELAALHTTSDPAASVIRPASGGVLDRFAADRMVKAAVRRAGLPAGVSAHWLRHAHVSHALDAGCGVHVVQATVGHASLATTSRYTHARPNESSSTFLKG